jgi:hypothetical protein
MTVLLRVILAIPVVLVAAWGGLALGLRLPDPAWLAHGVAGVFFAAVVVALLRVRPMRRKLATLAALFLFLFAWWAMLRPSNDRVWTPDVARLPTGEVHSDTLVLHNVRNFDYRSETDFTERWEDRTYHLSNVTGVDLFLSYWGSPNIAHTIMSWEFADGQHLAISIETRKERGEEYSAVRGFFRQYELYYVVADERDVIGRGPQPVEVDVFAVDRPRHCRGAAGARTQCGDQEPQAHASKRSRAVGASNRSATGVL